MEDQEYKEGITFMIRLIQTNKRLVTLVKSICIATLLIIFSGLVFAQVEQQSPSLMPVKIEQQPASESKLSEKIKPNKESSQDKNELKIRNNEENSLKMFKSWFDLLFGGALGAALGYLIKWFLEQFSLNVAARRKFAEKVTEQISTLATEHYWSLANYAGLVSGLLESYLQSRAYHLLLQWNDPSDLSRRLDELADETAKKSFPHLCRLIALFYAFQFEESNTYLLTEHAAGETCKRLYNAFVGSLPEELELANLYASEITDENGEKKKIGLVHPAYISDLVISGHKELAIERKKWRNWLRHNLENVIQTADALRAYNEILIHELANLYRDWFKKGQPGVPYADELVSNAWPNVITEQSIIVIGRTRQQPTLLSPLGAAITGEIGKVKEEPVRDKLQSGKESKKY
jgi:hypothetical protein